MRRLLNSPRGLPQRQQGVVLIVMLVILILGGSYLLVDKLSRASHKIENDRQTADALAEAKEALIGWAVSRNGPNFSPGMLPHPDRNNPPGYYDGYSDCPPSPAPAGAPQLLIGKIPSVGTQPPCPTPQTPVGIGARDSSGEVLWYAVSRNLLPGGGNAPINPDLLNNGVPIYPWLRVLNAAGTPVNSRVAFVVIAPGTVISGQSRPPPGPAAQQFLDNYWISPSGPTYRNWDFDGQPDDGTPCPPPAPGFCEDFIQGNPTDTNNSFNDQLVFVTIDELMSRIEARAAGEARMRLLEYFNNPNNFFFPNAATVPGGACAAPTREGFFPIACTPGGSFTTFPTTTFPGWFGANNWPDFLYYAVAPGCTSSTPGASPLDCGGAGRLTVGTRTNARAVVISAGRAISGTNCAGAAHNQSRPPNDVCQYLDDLQNTTGGDDTFTGPEALPTTQFNDQAFIVAP